MNSFLLSILLWIWDNRSFDSISKSNKAKIEAQTAYQTAHYGGAIANYENILNTSLFVEPEARLNLAHAYFQDKKYVRAKKIYHKLTRLNNKNIVSIARLQLAMIAIEEKDTLSALNYLKSALLTDEENKMARYDYEILKNRFHGQVEKPFIAAQKKQLATNIIVKPQMVTIQTIRTEQKKEVLQKLNTLRMTEAQALMLLDAMKTTEMKYLQNKQLKSNKKEDNGRW